MDWTTEQASLLRKIGVNAQQYETIQQILFCFQTPSNILTLMVLMRLLIILWFVLQCLVVPIGAHILPAPTSDFTASDAGEQEEYSAYDEGPAGVVRIRKDKMARRTVPLVTTYSQQLSSRIISPPLIGRTVTPFPRSHALRVHQRISVYRI